MSWDNDDSVIVNWHKGDICILVPNDQDAFRAIKDRLDTREAFVKCGINGYAYQGHSEEVAVNAIKEFIEKIEKGNN